MIIKLVRLSILAIALMLVPPTVDARIMNFAPNMTNTDGGLYVVNCNEAISLRRAPSYESEVLLEIPLGEVVHVIDDFNANDSEFAHVKYRGTEGWALYRYLSAQATILAVVNCQENVSMRTRPDFDAPVMALIPLGEQVRFVRAEPANFYYISYRGHLGYVNDEYLALAW